MSLKEQDPKSWAQRWDCWCQSSKGSGFLAFLIILSAILLVTGGIVLGMFFFTADPEKWGSVIFLIMALIILLSPRWR